MASDTLNKLFLDILVSKNKLSLLRTYYTNIKNGIVKDLNDLYDNLISDVAWVDNKITSLAVTKSDALTLMSKFIANTEDALIVNHEKYQEMMGAYGGFVSDFYSRMINLYADKYYDFTENSISGVNSEWKFHYADDYSNAIPIKHKFGPLNITSESNIFELTNNRFIYMTNDNIVYDVNYTTKDVYLVDIDSKTFTNEFNYQQGTEKLYFGHERAHFVTLFRLKNRSKIYALINIGPNYINSISGDVIGNGAYSGKAQRLVVCEYNYEDHEFKLVTRNTSNILVVNDLIKSHKFNFIDATIDDYYFYYIGPYLVRFKVDGISSDNVDQKLLGTSQIDIECAVIDNDNYLIVPISQKRLGVYQNITNSVDFSNPNVRTFDTSSISSQFVSGEEGVIKNMFYITNIGRTGRAGIYLITDKSIYFTENRFSNIIKDQRTSNISITNLTFNNKDEYLIDEYGYLYILGENTRLYCAKTSNGTSLEDTVVESPTRYADKIVNISSLITNNLAGYIFSLDASITKAQSSDAGGESFIYTFTSEEVDINNEVKFYGITETGKVVIMDIEAESNKLIAVKHSICGNKKINCITYDSVKRYFFLNTADGNMYYISLDLLISANETEASYLSTINLNSTVNSILCIDNNLYFGCKNGHVGCFSIERNGEYELIGTVHTMNVNVIGYEESDSANYCINDGKAIGNVAVKQLITDNACLIVLGELGRVASCALKSKIWTSYEGVAIQNGSKIDSLIYFNGEGLNYKDIICSVNYSNSKLIIIGEEGYIASCNMTTGNWTTCYGTTESHGSNGVGPGIYNNGTILGGADPTCATRIGNIAYIAGKYGRMGSINISTGGLTEYRGTDPENSTVVGPGAYYEGTLLSTLDKTTAICSSTKNAIAIMSGTGSFILSYSTGAKELLSPTTDKLYYIARRQSPYDYLSSLLVRVIKGTLNEYPPLYPAKEEDTVNEMAYESSFYVYRNGDFIWRISTAFDKAYFSNNGGITYESKEIENFDVLPNISVNTPRLMPMGVVSNDGELMFLITVSNGSYFVYGKPNDDGSIFVSWSNRRSVTNTQREINSLRCLDNGINHKFIYTSDEGYCYELVYDISNNSVNNVSENLNNKYSFKAINEFGRTFNLFKNNNESYEFDIFLDNMILGDTRYVFNYLNNTYKNKINDINEAKILNIFYTKGNNLNFVICTRELLFLVTIKFKEFKENVLDDFDKYEFISKEIDLSDIKLENAKNNYTENYETDITTFEIDTNSSYIVTNYDGDKGFLGFDVEILSENCLSSNKRHVIVSLNCNLYGGIYISNAKIYQVLNSAARKIAFDSKRCEIQIARYNTTSLDGLIIHTNGIDSYREIEALPFTPLRALTDAWKTCELKLTDNGINSFALRLKLRNTTDANENDAIQKDFTLRYQVLISDITNGKYILYEVEKSTGMCKIDNETKVVEPFIKVIAIDGFEDSILELFNSRKDDIRQDVFVKKSISSSSNFVGEIDSRIETTYDFMTYFQKKNLNTNDINGTNYQILIKPLNTLPASMDAEFFIEPYTFNEHSRNNSTSYIKNIKNNIDKSEFKAISAEAETTLNYIFGIPGINGFLTKSQLDIGPKAYKPYSTNINHYPQYDEKESDISIGRADTYMSIIDGKGNGLFDKINGIIMYTDSNSWKIVPLSVNKEDIRYSFDESGSANIQSSMDINVLKNSRNLHKMRNFSIFSKGVSNDADYYVDFDSKRIAKVEGTMTNPNGLYEVVSSIDGQQKRIKRVTEEFGNSFWRTITNAYENIKYREYGKSYDIIDRYSVFEEPYYNLQAWWIPASGYITKGNERMLSLGFDETSKSYGSIGRRYLPGDAIEEKPIVPESYSGKESPANSGINNAINGIYDSTTKVIAVRELLDEKFPLERWDGFEFADLCFIRKWKIVYTDDTIEYNYEIESPMKENVSNPTSPTSGTVYTVTGIPIPGTPAYNNIPEAIRNPIPSIPKNLYSYWDDLDWEGRGKQIFKYAIAYYYTSHNWKIYKHEVVEKDYDWTSEQYNLSTQKTTKKSYYDSVGNKLNSAISTDNDETKIVDVEDQNYARTQVTTNTTENKWYVPPTNDVNHESINHHNNQYSSLYSISLTSYPKVNDDRGIYEFNAFPRAKNSIVGQMITNMFVPTVKDLYMLEGKYQYEDLGHDDTSRSHPGSIKVKILHKGYYVTEEENMSLAYMNGGRDFTYTSSDSKIKIEMSKTGYVTNKFCGSVTKSSIGKCNWDRTESTTETKSNGDIVIRPLTGPTSGINGYPVGKGDIVYTQNEYSTVANNIRPYCLANFNTVGSNNDKNFIIDYRSYYADCREIDTSNDVSKVTLTTGSSLAKVYCGAGSFSYLHKYLTNVKVTLVYTYNGATDTSGKYKMVNGSKTYLPYSRDYYRYKSSNLSLSYTFYDGNGSYTAKNETDCYVPRQAIFPSVGSDTIDKILKASVDPAFSTNTISGVTSNSPGNILNCTVREVHDIKADGTTSVSSISAQNKYRWIKLEAVDNSNGVTVDGIKGDVLITPTTSDGSRIDEYLVNCWVCLEWYDGTVIKRYAQITIGDLKTKWGIAVESSSVVVGKNSSNTGYQLTYTIVFNGVSLNKNHYDGNVLTTPITVKVVRDVQFAESANTIGAANPGNVSTWSDASGIVSGYSGNGLNH